MSITRYELSEGQWLRIEPLLPGRAGDPERSGSDNRLFVNGCLWCCGLARTGATSRSVMVAGRRCTSASAGGRTRVFGGGSSSR
jgi:hypothetical protein